MNEVTTKQVTAIKINFKKTERSGSKNKNAGLSKTNVANKL